MFDLCQKLIDLHYCLYCAVFHLWKKQAAICWVPVTNLTGMPTDRPQESSKFGFLSVGGWFFDLFSSFFGKLNLLYFF